MSAVAIFTHDNYRVSTVRCVANPAILDLTAFVRTRSNHYTDENLNQDCCLMLTKPKTEEEQDTLVSALDLVLDAGGADEKSEPAKVGGLIGDLVAEYEDEYEDEDEDEDEDEHYPEIP